MPLEQPDKEETAKLLSSYWQERGMDYSKDWALQYLEEGHKKEIKEDLFYSYTEDGETVGTVSLVVEVSGVAEVRDLVIKPEHRGKGYGQMILQELEMYAMEKQVRKLFALVFEDSQKLLLDAGFEEEGMLKSHFAKGEDLIIMSKFI